MPIKEFDCSVCNHRFEMLVRSSDTEQPECPECKSRELVSVLTYPGNYNIKGDNSSSARPKGGLTGRSKK